jgi:hypothetical protein
VTLTLHAEAAIASAAIEASPAAREFTLGLEPRWLVVVDLRIFTPEKSEP